MQKLKESFKKLKNIIKQRGPAFLLAVVRNTAIIITAKVFAAVILAHFGIEIS